MRSVVEMPRSSETRQTILSSSSVTVPSAKTIFHIISISRSRPARSRWRFRTLVKP
jgi:hypothetical protein